MTQEQIKQINLLSKEVFENNKAKGFWDKERNIGELLMLVTSELGEAMEAHRKNRICNLRDDEKVNMDWHTNAVALSNTKEYFETHIKDTFEDEIADAVIRLFDMCGGLGIDLGAQIYHKLEYNKTREVRHGKAY